MTRAPRIQLPSAREDQLRPAALAATCIACALAGAAFSYVLSSHAPPTGPSPRQAASEPASARSNPSETTLAWAATAQTDSGLAQEPGLGPPIELGPRDAAPEPEPEPERDAPDDHLPVDDAGTPPEKTAASGESRATDVPAARRVTAGIVAYLRCDGLMPKRGRKRCPRDRELEHALRAIAETLGQCRLASQLARGMSDVRIDIGPSGVVQDLQVRTRSNASEQAIRACVGVDLRKLTTHLRPERMIVSQRFSVH